MAIAVAESHHTATAGPAIEVFAFGSGLDPVLDDRERNGITGAEVVFAERDAAEADMPCVTISARFVGQFVDPCFHRGEVLFIAGGEQEEHARVGETFGCIRFGNVVGETADDFFRLRAIERPGLAVGPKHRNVDDDGLYFCLDGKLEHAVGGLGFREDVAKLDARVDVLEGLAVDCLDDLAFLESGGFGGRAGFNGSRPDCEGGLVKLDGHTDRAETLDGCNGFFFCGRGGEDRLLLVKGLRGGKAAYQQ